MSRIEKEFLAAECGVDESEVYNSFSDNQLTDTQIEIVKILLQDRDFVSKAEFLEQLIKYDLDDILVAQEFICK